MFEGFTPETVDFLWGIRMNNNKEWFTANKKQYTDFLYHPMKELGKELFEPFLDKPGNLLRFCAERALKRLNDKLRVIFARNSRSLDGFWGGIAFQAAR